MSYKGHLFCKNCKLCFTLGKLRYADADLNKVTPSGFWGPDVSQEVLGRIVLHFLAQHVKHDVMLAGDPIVEHMTDLCEYDRYEIIDDNCPYAQTHEPVYLGGVKFYLMPCEPPSAREQRLRNARK